MEQIVIAYKKIMEAARLLAAAAEVPRPNDHEVLHHGFIICDALYAWASHRTTETHSWPPQCETGSGMSRFGT